MTDLGKSGSKNNLGLILILIATFGLSIEGVAAKLAYQSGINVLTALVLRYLIAALVFWLIVLTAKQNFCLPFPTG